MATNSNGSIPLRSWINSALSSIDISEDDPRRNDAVSSDEYLIAALNVARSLAQHMCQAEGGEGISLLPKPDDNWAGQIAVELVDGPSCSDELLANQEEVGAGTTATGSKVVEGEGSKGSPSFLSVAGAELITSSFDDDSSGDNNGVSNKDQRLYSLGLVFYELFSGGEKPPTEVAEAERKEKEDMCDTEEQRNNGDIKLSNALNIADENGDNEAEGRHSKRLTMHSGPTFSFESLKARAVPNSICDLIANMINSIVQGEFSSDETYTQMSEVVVDLQLMLERPTKYLHDLDLEKLSKHGLGLNETIFGRETEFSTIQESYRRSIDGGSECGIISGPSGVGKSLLAQRLNDYMTEGGGIFLSGKFDERKLTTPFSALASAFNEYCVKMSCEGNLGFVQDVQDKLRLALGAEAHYLVKVIPKLTLILGEDFDVQMDNEDCADPQQRLLYLLSKFVEVISTSSGVPIVLFLDDVQWSDVASIEILYQLLLTSGSSDIKRQLYFLACMRNEISDDHPFINMMSRVQKFNVNITMVELGCMDEHEINSFVSDMLCLSPRLTKALASLVYHKTKGSPFFISRLIVSLSKDNLLRLSLQRKRWVWDEDNIQLLQLSDDVVSFIVDDLRKLPPDVQLALTVLSCLGARSDMNVIKVLGAGMDLPLLKPLEIAINEGLVTYSKANEQFLFSHDRIQEAVYHMIEEKKRSILHLKLGVSLVPVALESQDDAMLFAATNQLNCGSKAVQDDEQALLIANLNLEAGHKAIEMSDFTSAFNFFDHGISFLKKRHWEKQYKLSLALFNGATQSSFAIGDLDSLQLLCEQILSHAQTLHDQLHSLYILVHALTSASQLNDAIDKGMVVLAQLGEALPDADNVSDTNANILLEETKEILRDVTDEQLLNYHEMDDTSTIMAMKILARLEHPIQLARPNFQPFATLKMVNLSLSMGLSPESPAAFTYYGIMLARKGDMREGCRYVKLAFKLLDGIGSREVAGQVMTMGAEVLSYIEPLQATFEYSNHGFDASMAAGDTANAGLNNFIRLTKEYWASNIKLQTVREGYTSLCRLLLQHNQLTYLTLLSLSQISLLTLLGLEDELGQVPEDFKGNLLAAMIFHFHCMNVGYLFRRYDQMVSSAEEYFGFNIKSWSIAFTDSCQTFIAGLVSFYVYRTSKDKIWYDRGQKATQDMRQWADSSEWNFNSKLFLLEAEMAYSENNMQAAESSYDKAILAAKDHRFIIDEALSCECAGYFHLSLDKKDTAVQYFMQSQQAYDKWGAVAKSRALLDYIQQTFGSCDLSTPATRPHVLDKNDISRSLVGNSESRKRTSD